MESSFGEREAAKADRVEIATDDVHQLIDQQTLQTSEANETPRRIIANGTMHSVVESYVDARGNEWVVAPNGQQFMNFQEVAEEPLIESAEVAGDQDSAVATEHEPPVADAQRVEADTANDEALAAAEAHLNEFIASRNFVKESVQTVSLQQEQATLPHEQESEVTQEEVPAKEEAPEMEREVDQQATSYEQAERGENRKVGDALQVLHRLKSQLSVISDGRIDDYYRPHINASLEAANGLVKSAQAANRSKEKVISDADTSIGKGEEVLAREGARDSQVTLRQSRHDLRKIVFDNRSSDSESLTQVLSMIDKMNPHYARYTRDIVKPLNDAIARLTEVHEKGRRRRNNPLKQVSDILGTM